MLSQKYAKFEGEFLMCNKLSIITILLIGIILTGCSKSQDSQSGKNEKTLVIAEKGEQTKDHHDSSNKEKTAKQDDSQILKQSESYKVTFIELGSVRCIPCKMMQPIMEEIEKEYIEQVKVVFHDVWTPEGRPYAVEYGIRVIPTQVFLDKDNKEYFRHEGFFPKEELINVLRQQGVE